MNGRTIRKLLMRGRTGTFFGGRAMFVVRVPLAAIPEPIPKFDPPAPCTGLEGHWRHQNEDGTSTLFTISELHCFKKPSEILEEYKFRPTVHHAQLDDSWTDDDGTVHESWTFFEGVEILFGPKSDPDRIGEVLSRKNLPTEMVDAYVAKRRWIAKYATGEAAGKTDIDWLDELHYAAGYARRFQPIIRGATMDLAYFIKWWHPRTKLGFCAAMHRALKTAKRAGVAVHVHRPPVGQSGRGNQ